MGGYCFRKRDLKTKYRYSIIMRNKSRTKERSVIELTIFGSDSEGKVPYSPYSDNTFDFETKQYATLKEAFAEMVESFTLSKPISIQGVKRMERNAKALNSHNYNRLTSLAVDLDKIRTEAHYKEVVDYFKKSDYSVILGKSRNWNGETNFNIKGIIRVDIRNESKQIKNVLRILQRDLGERTEVDLSVGNSASYQAPIRQSYVIYNKEMGSNIIDDNQADIIQIQKETEKLPLPQIGLLSKASYNQSITDLALSIFQESGFTMVGSQNANGSVNFKHGSEVHSPGGYFWFRETPFVMHHNNSDKSLNIFSYIKDTPQGKEFLRNLSREEQTSQLSCVPNYSNYAESIVINDRYIKVNKKIKEMVNKFVLTEKGVLKLLSPMGTGKSNVIGEVIENTHKKGKSVLIVSNRISVAKDYASKHDLKLYQDAEYYRKGESMVVQFDSLHKYTIKDFDVVILDEFMSVLLHHRGNLTTNQNLNVAKFYSLLKTKKVVIADAFLTGYEDNYLEGRVIYNIENSFRDDIRLTEYTNKENFLSTLYDTVDRLEPTETLSASFMSVNALRVAELELKSRGKRVITLTSETPEITKGLIYDKFDGFGNEHWDVILYTPTLTVGVSNLNNVKHHFHYDTGNAGDVISSLQMVKRSRNAEHIHYYIQERQYYNDTDLATLNTSAEMAIKNHYKNRDKTLLVEYDIETGEYALSEIGKYVNTIEVLYNILENNHANAFRTLLVKQFKNKSEVNNKVDDSFSLLAKTKEIKNLILMDKIALLEEYSNTTWNPEEIRELKGKMTEKTPEEKTKLMLSIVQDKFSVQIPRDDLVTLTQHEIESGYEYISKLKRLSLATSGNNDYLMYRLSEAVSSDIKSLQDKSEIQFLEYLIMTKGRKLSNWYSKNDIIAIDIELGQGNRFEKFLKKIGYEWKNNRMMVDNTMLHFMKYTKKDKHG